MVVDHVEDMEEDLTAAVKQTVLKMIWKKKKVTKPQSIQKRVLLEKCCLQKISSLG